MINYEIYEQILKFNPNAKWENYKNKSTLECLCILEYYKRKLEQEEVKEKPKLLDLRPKTRIGQYGQKQVLTDNGHYEDYID